MKQEYEKLDRDIFEATVGITKITSVKSGERKKTNAKILSDSFIDSLSDDTRKKLLERLQKNIELADCKRCDMPLTTVDKPG